MEDNILIKKTFWTNHFITLGGAARNNGVARGTRQANVPYKPSAGNTVGIFGLANGGSSGVAKRSILDRLGTPKGAGGCKVIVENLGGNVSENDLKELCEMKGEVTNVICKFIRTK
jgi:hypothetical protein